MTDQANAEISRAAVFTGYVAGFSGIALFGLLVFVAFMK